MPYLNLKKTAAERARDRREARLGKMGLLSEANCHNTVRRDPRKHLRQDKPVLSLSKKGGL